jgi:hypothetical protein
MLYRLLRRYESIENGLIAKDPLSDESVYNHITSSGKVGFQSKFISTCGSLSAVLKFAGVNEFPRIAKIWEKNLPVVKIYLRIQENRDNYHIGNNANENEKFDNYARAFEEVLLVGYVPETHVELLTKSDFYFEICPVWLEN